MVWPLGDDFNLWRREVGIGVHGHPLKRYYSPDRDESGQHQHQKSLTERRLDYSVDHSVVVDTILGFILARVVVTFLKACAILLALQRVRKLQEQAAISYDLVTSFQPAGNLRLSVQAFSERDGASAKLFRTRRGINKRLVLAIAQYSSIRESNGICDRARVYGGNHVHIFLQFLAGIVGLDARLQRTRVRIERCRDVGNAAVEDFRISIRLDCDRISNAHVGQILLIDIDQHPDAAGIRNHETLGGARLDELPRGHILLDDLA